MLFGVGFTPRPIQDSANRWKATTRRRFEVYARRWMGGRVRTMGYAVTTVSIAIAFACGRCVWVLGLDPLEGRLTTSEHLLRYFPASPFIMVHHVIPYLYTYFVTSNRNYGHLRKVMLMTAAYRQTAAIPMAKPWLGAGSEGCRQIWSSSGRRLFPMQKLVTRRTLVDNFVLFHSRSAMRMVWVCGRRGGSSGVGRLPAQRPEEATRSCEK